MRSTLIGMACLFSVSVFAAGEKSNEAQWIAMGNKQNVYRIQDCPVVGNKESGIYHLPVHASYKKMLVKNKGQDNRACFESEEQAQTAGYRKALK